MFTALYPVNQLKIGGAEQQLLELVRGLDKERFRPIVAPLYPGGALEAEFLAIPGVEVESLDRRGKYDPLPLWRIARLLRERQVDVVQPFLSPSTFFGLLPALIVGTPVKVVTERCGVRRQRGYGNRAYRSAEDLLSRFANAIVPNSYAGERMLLERGLPRSKISVIYNGINEERLLANRDTVALLRERSGAPARGTLIGILASLTPAKGHDVLIRAMALMREQIPEVRLAIVGDGPSRQSLETLTDELHLTEHVIFFGYQRNVADFLAAFDLLVSASRDNEGCSNSILEAMAARVPVIATDVGGNRELIEHGETGLLVPVGDERALAEAVVQLLRAPLKMERVARGAREMITRQFSLERMVRDYEALYIQLCHERQAHGSQSQHDYLRA